MPEYENIVPRLTSFELSALESELWWKGKLDQTFWVCCFSVDQHVGICGSVCSSDTDPVTGQLHPTCDCSMDKSFSYSKPTREDGQSIHCEMNKFDDLIQCLASIQPGFEQIVAVDLDFRLFQRTWCIAELHKASVLGLSQFLRLPCEQSLKDRTHELKNLRVE